MRTLALLLVLLASTAQAQDTSKVTPALTPAEAAKVRDEVKQLGQAFGIDPPKPEPKAETTATKSMPEVADKALDMVGGLVASISQSLQKVAPQVWRIMIRQQYAKAVTDLVFPWSVVLLCWAYHLLLRKRWNGNAEDKFWVGGALPLVVGMVFCLVGLYRLSDSMSYLINPEYYAVRDLLLMVMNPRAVTN
jgi:hypothetical protein